MKAAEVSIVTTLLALSGCATTSDVMQKRLFSISSSPLGVRTKTANSDLSSSSLPQLVTVTELEPYMVRLLFQVRHMKECAASRLTSC